MTGNRAWHLVEPSGAGERKVAFRWPNGVNEDFTQSQLRATIGVLRMQGKPTKDYEEALAGLVAAGSAA